MSDVIDSRHRANIAPCREEIVRDLHHRGEDLDRNISQADEETTLVRVDVDLDEEERVPEMHSSIRVEYDQRHPLQARYRDLPQC